MHKLVVEVSKTSPRPNFFIVGGPKCGTTSLYNYLSRHPDVFMCPSKEPQFFAADTLGEQRSICTLEDYLRCFSAARNQKRIGEASTAYLGSATAAQSLKEFSPGARIVIMLRNPVDVIYAQHSERVFNNTEHILEFEAALNSKERRVWRSGRFKNQQISYLGYRELSRFASQVRRYFDVFGRENVNVVIYDDFKANTAACYAEVLRFLGIAPDGNEDFSIANANRRARSILLQEFLQHPPKPVQRFTRLLLSSRRRSALVGWVRELNVVYQPRPPMNEKLRKRLQKEYEPEVQELSRILDRDLSSWSSS